MQLSSERLILLLDALGIDSESYLRVAEWVLCERLAQEMLFMMSDDPALLTRPDAMRRFRDALVKRTGRSWSRHDLEALFERYRKDASAQFREPIPIEDLMLLYIEEPLECSRCHAAPPEAKLHIDHIEPASRGGHSRRSNLQFLCEKHNLEKSNKREVTDPWLDLA
jgi:hypothetical protein